MRTAKAERVAKHVVRNVFFTILMTSSALAGSGIHAACADSLVVDGEQKKIDSAEVFDDVIVGYTQPGSHLEISDGGSATVGGSAYLGLRPHSEGEVAVSGAGSQMSVTNDLTVGGDGIGLLNVASRGQVYVGGDVKIDAAVAAQEADSSDGGTGSGSCSTDSSQGCILLPGSALTVAGQGVPPVIFTMPGSTSQGSVYVSGSGSTLVAQGNLVIGEQAHAIAEDGPGGMLVLSDGGSVRVEGEARLGNAGSATGAALVSGAGSLLAVGEDMLVGSSGSGGLAVLGGASLSVGGDAIFGVGQGSTGTASIAGVGSLMTVSGDVTVGANGQGSFAVVDGGQVYATGNVSIDAVLPTFFVPPDGPGGTVTLNCGSFVVGSIPSDGCLSGDGRGNQGVPPIIIAASVGTTRDHLLVSGAGSRLVADGDIAIGKRSYSVLEADSGGVMSLREGGVAEVGGDLMIAANSGSVGSLVIGAELGDAAMAAGSVRGLDGAAASIAFGQGVGSLVFNHLDTDYAFDANVSGSGKLLQSFGRTRLTGDFSGFSGMAEVAGGRLSVDTVFGGDVVVAAGGALAGTGKVRGATFEAGSDFGVDLSDDDYLVTQGLVIENGVNIAVGAGGVAGLRLGESRTIIEWDAVTDSIPTDGLTLDGPSGLSGAFAGPAQGLTFDEPFGLTGAFAGVDEDFLFVDAELGRVANTFALTFNRNGAAVSDFARTPNQKAVASGVESLDEGGVYDAFLLLSEAAGVPEALDQVSGEVHASARGSMLRNAGYERDAVNERIRASFGDLASRAMDRTATASIGYSPAAPASTRDYGVWVQTYGAGGQVAEDGNASEVAHVVGGLLAGLDVEAGNDWRIGAFGGRGLSRASIDALSSDADTDSYSVGLYAGRLAGPLRAQFGASYAWHDVSSDRSVGFSGSTEHLEADYDATTMQAFAEVGYAFAVGTFAYEPFAGLAVIRQDTDAFNENGGDAALSVSSSTDTLAVSSIGLRTTYDYGQLANGTSLVLDGAAAWKHSFGDVAPLAEAEFASGGLPFTVAGAPLDRDTAVIEAGLSFGDVDSMNLRVGYQGEFGAHAADHAFNARLAVKF